MLAKLFGIAAIIGIENAGLLGYCEGIAVQREISRAHVPARETPLLLFRRRVVN
ncbi:MAG: hypothetical protein ABSG77_11270 [Candidatus Acidiferrum sp.]|jgi:hypothetical protein